MAIRNPVAVNEHDVFALTKKGNDELGGSDTTLAPAEIELLIRIDGKSTVAQIGVGVRTLPRDNVVATLQRLLSGGWIQAAPKSDAIDAAGFFDAPARKPSAQAMSKAKTEATSGVTTLDKQGYYVRIARRATKRRLAGGAAVLVVVVEDEPILAKFLRQYLEIEGFEVRLAANRQEIVTAITRPPVPGLVLLDVMLPDADGFDILHKMRQHTVLKSVPVIMLTAKATRGAVLKGIAGGADGYVTKPFDAETLIHAVRSVLGLPKGSGNRDSWSRAGI